jgi:omega-hydroxy-beta-dihydromenaquinone-9 sulfotransferase
MNQKTSNLCFIVGPGRSGSTLLYKVLGLHARIGFLSNYDVRYPSMPWFAGMAETVFASTAAKLNAWFDKSGGAYYLQRPLAKKLVPTPVEGESLLVGCGLRNGKAVIDPDEVGLRLGAVLGRLQDRKQADVLLLKRTALNQSIPLLHRIFPDARFIFLIRDGRSVCASLLKVEWWPDNPLPWADEKTPTCLEAEGRDPVWIAAQNWVAGVGYAQEGLNGVPDSKVFKLRYEDFLGSSAAVMTDLLQFLGVRPSPEFDSALAQLALSGRPDAWPRQLTPAQQEIVHEVQGSLLRQYGYL